MGTRLDVNTGSGEHRIMFSRYRNKRDITSTDYEAKCACGWQSGLCATREQAKKLGDAHKESVDA